MTISKEELDAGSKVLREAIQVLEGMKTVFSGPSREEVREGEFAASSQSWSCLEARMQCSG